MTLNRSELNDLLLQIGAHFYAEPENESEPDAKSSINSNELRKLSSRARRHPDLIPYHLDYDDIVVIASAWHRLICSRETQFDPLELLNTIYSKPDSIRQLDRVVALLRKNIFYTREKQVINRKREYGSDTEIKYFKYSLLENDICFHRSFTRLLMNEIEDVSKNAAKPYRSNKEFVADWISYVKQLGEFSFHDFEDRRFDAVLEEGVANDYLKALEWKKRIYRRLKRTRKTFPLMEIVSDYQLDHNETVILMYLVKEELADNTTSSEELIDLISRDQHEKYANRKYLDPDANLVRHGLIELKENFFFRSHGSEVRVTPDITRQIIMKTPVNDEERLRQMIKGDSVFTLLEPVRGFNDLILPRDMKHTIQSALSRYESNVEQTLASWGLYSGETQAVGKISSREPGLLMLFYGPPGTGKTFAAGAIARKLNKKLLITDISRIQSKWVGESEKNVRRIFSVFERIVRRTENPPVLLLNEADQFLSRRVENMNTSVDVMYNSMQNLFLEAFERLKGIMIATTNLKANLDAAFSRRFHLKLEFPQPGVKERIALWNLHLPKTIPGAREIDSSWLARKYSLTGGQISIIVKNAATEAASRRGKRRKLTLEDLIKYCELEQDSMFDRTWTDIGFKPC
ncbi:MAG: ATP-binding protein [Calditrichaeota bacterium]|nr:MAG: ATP-binding protein [Calditrichota bacterium]